MTNKSFIKPVLAFLALGLIIAAFVFFDAKEMLNKSLHWIHGLGFWGPLAFILIYISACVFFVPGSVLTLGAGLLFGVVKGTVFVSAGSTLGAAAAFLIGRYLARDWISGKMQGNEKFKTIDEAVKTEGWKIVGLVRLSPIFPFNIINYAFGLTRVSLKHYFLASWIGMLPGTVMYVYLGSLAGNLSQLGSAGQSKSWGEWTLYGIGLLATIGVTVYITKIAKKALQKKIS